MLCGMIMELLGSVVRHATVMNARRVVPEWLRVAIACLDDHYAERLSIAVVAGACGVTAARLRRGVQQWYRHSFAALLRERRVAAALALIESEIPLHEVARVCGFYDLSHFTRTFTAIRGVTPHRYRSRLRSGAVIRFPNDSVAGAVLSIASESTIT